MVKHLFPNFLHDEAAHAQAERYWVDLWNQIDPSERIENGWAQPWFQPLPPSLSEGNPSFSAVSPTLKRGVRILQSEPTEAGLEFFAYPDTFGRPEFDPEAIHELVISCTLSDVVARHARSLISPCVMGLPISFDLNDHAVVGLTSPQ